MSDQYMPGEAEVSSALNDLAYVLNRVRRDDRIQSLMGLGTESFTRLTRAFSALSGERHSSVCNSVIEGSSDIHCPESNEG